MPFADDNPVNIADNYSTYQYPDALQRIYNFLTDENAMRAALLALQHDAVDQNVQTEEDFEIFLENLEGELGFQGVEEVPQFLADTDAFFAYLERRVTMFDLGAGADHGYNTHRVQWVLIGRYSDLGLPAAAAELYQSIAKVTKNSRVGYHSPLWMPRFLWDAVFDREEDNIRNGTRPEYLHHDWLWEPAQDELDLLREVWR